MSDILQRLADVEEAKSGASFRHGCIECGLSAVLCADAANEIENLRRERDEAQALLRETQKRLDREEVAAFKATSERDRALALLRECREWIGALTDYEKDISTQPTLGEMLARLDAALRGKDAQ